MQRAPGRSCAPAIADRELMAVIVTVQYFSVSAAGERSLKVGRRRKAAQRRHAQRSDRPQCIGEFVDRREAICRNATKEPGAPLGRGSRIVGCGQISYCVRGCDNPDPNRQATRWRGKPCRIFRCALAGARTRPLWPGPTRHVQSASLKAVDLSSGRLSRPGCRRRLPAWL